MNTNRLYEILRAIKDGNLELDEAKNMLKNLPFEDLSYAKIDHHRHLRRGLPEVIYGEGKTVDQIEGITKSLKAQKVPVLITRLDQAKWDVLRSRVTFLTYSKIAGCAWYRSPSDPLPGNITICAAGTSDLPVAEEAAITIETMGHSVIRLSDIGVAGLHRMLAHLDELRKADVIIAVAGMEGALPSVLAGLVDCPVIGVPTSVGYGTSFGGVTPLLSMLNSCASGVTVVNIDNGFGAGYAATLMVRRQYRKDD
ncbi:nickel pincer cofactor biosynthesis protein LarB [bacterium]|nr:nickel pincer cofactor biosynthesis protein LarB [bacterium]